MERLGSAMSDSMSMLQLVTAMGWIIATCEGPGAAAAKAQPEVRRSTTRLS